MTSIGIRHVHLLVAEQDRAIVFYRDVFGMEERFRDGLIVFLGPPAGFCRGRRRLRCNRMIHAGRVP